MSITYNVQANLKRFTRLAKSCLALTLLVVTAESASCEDLEHNPISSTLSKTSNDSFFSSNDAEFLTAEDAFQLNSTSTLSGLTLIWNVAKDYYLYQHRFTIMDAEGQDITDKALFMPGTAKHDEYFGDVEVYYYQAIIEIPYSSLNCESNSACKNRTLTVKYQGCAEAGLCYPIQAQQITL